MKPNHRSRYGSTDKYACGRPVVRALYSIIIISLSGCILFRDSYDPPDPSEFSPATMVSDAKSENDEDSDAWYNASFLRSWFGDFKHTDTVYVTDPESAGSLIVRGEKLVNGAAACGVCHSYKAGDVRSPLSGGRKMKDSFGALYAANITPSSTGIGGWNVFEVMRAIRSSIDKAGRPLSIDLHQGYRWMSDQDAKAISLYLLSLQPIDNKVERRTLGGFERNRWGIIPIHSEVVGYVPEPTEEASIGYGRYLANNVSNCVQCHTAGGAKSGNVPFGGFYSSGGFTGLFREIMGLFETAPLEEDLAGELLTSNQYDNIKRPKLEERELNALYDEAIIEGDFPVGGPNIRGKSEAGLKKWSEEDIVSYLSSGKTPDGEQRERRFCPWDRYARMNPTSKQAIAMYLKSL